MTTKTKHQTAWDDKLRTMSTAAAKVAAEMQSEYDTLSTRYRTLCRERDSILALPIPREDLIERLQEWADEQQARMRQRLKQELSFDSITFSGKNVHETPALLRQRDPNLADNMLPFLRVSTGLHAGGHHEFGDQLFMGLLASFVKNALADTINSFPWYPEEVAPPREEREAMLAKLDSQIDSVSANMDDLKASAKQAGITLKDRV